MVAAKFPALRSRHASIQSSSISLIPRTRWAELDSAFRLQSGRIDISLGPRKLRASRILALAVRCDSLHDDWDFVSRAVVSTELSHSTSTIGSLAPVRALRSMSHELTQKRASHCKVDSNLQSPISSGDEQTRLLITYLQTQNSQWILRATRTVSSDPTLCSV